ncbi:hypothetical protein BGZ60DRAFT_420205 [Tricladium varicosporioides]|nr:hypothetical protein BGZ60DRAFT_420205 [Hymenoscyphus varicosporioides]
MKTENYQPGRSMISSSTRTTGTRKGRNSSTTDLKQTSSQTSAPLPSSKRSCSTPPTKAGSNMLGEPEREGPSLMRFGDSIA